MIVPTLMDGTPNTVMHAAIRASGMEEYLLAAVQHASQPSSAGDDSRGPWQINVEPNEGKKGG